MAIKLEDKQNVDAPNAEYEYGNIRDIAGPIPGTELDMVTHADYFQYFARMLALSGITINDLPDSSYNGYQYYEALLKTIRSEAATEISVVGSPGRIALPLTIGTSFLVIDGSTSLVNYMTTREDGTLLIRMMVVVKSWYLSMIIQRHLQGFPVWSLVQQEVFTTTD